MKMDFDFSSEQLLLRDQARDFLAKECPPAFVRRMLDDAAGYSDAMWRQMADLGMLGLAIPEEYGGLGLGLVEQALVLEEMGRMAYPGPYFATTVLAATAIAAGGSEAQKAQYLPAIAEGKLKGTVALMEESVAWGPASVHTRAEQIEGGYRLNGLKRFVPFVHTADFILIPARDAWAEGLSFYLVDKATPGMIATPMTSLDQTNKMAQLTFADAVVPAACVLGTPGQGAAVMEAVLQRAAVAASAEMLGAARQCLDMSVAYAKTREQFGQPIGAFQAIKHKLADMLLEVESAHAATYYAAWAQDAHAEDASLAASVAKAYVSDAARKVCGEAIQVHGGIGFTWDYDLHLYFKRAKHLEPLYGDAEYHRERALQALPM